MDPKQKFKFKAFLTYLVIEPWTEKISLPNFSSLIWIVIIVSLIIRNILLLWISILIGIIFNAIKEYKSGKFIYWYRNRNKDYSKSKEALKKIRRGRDIILDEKELNRQGGENVDSGEGN